MEISGWNVLSSVKLGSSSLKNQIASQIEISGL